MHPPSNTPANTREHVDTNSYLNALRTLQRLAPLLDDQLHPTQGNCQDSYKPPRLPTSRPPLNLTWLDTKAEVEQVLRAAWTQLRKDTGNQHGQPVPTIQGMTGWLLNQADALTACFWLDSNTWWEMTTGRKGTLAGNTTAWARLLEDTLNPPMKPQQTGTATQMSQATGIPAETIRTWGKRGKVQRFPTPQGTHVYRLDDLQKLLT